MMSLMPTPLSTPLSSPMLHYPEDVYPSSFVTLNGAKIHFKTAGSGPPCLLLHGYPETWYTWRHTMQALAPHYTVYAPDFRGWGDSEAKGPYSLRSLVEDTLALMDSLGHARYTVIAHDWGAAAAYAIARSFPNRIEKLVTANMPVKRFDATKVLHFYFFNTPLLPEVTMKLASDWVVKGILRWWAHNQAAFPPEVIALYQQAARKPGANAATLAYYRNTARSVLLRRKEAYGLGAKPTRPDLPWLMLWGDKDAVSPLKNVVYFKEDMPGVPVEMIRDAGHFPQEEQPEQFNRLALAFLRA